MIFPRNPDPKKPIPSPGPPIPGRPRLSGAPLSAIWLTAAPTVDVIWSVTPGKGTTAAPRASDVLDGIVVGSKGYYIYFNCLDEGYVAVNISAYNGDKTLYMRSPDDTQSVSISLSFVTTGTDGKLRGQMPSTGIDREGEWKGQLELKSTGGMVIYSSIFPILISGSLI